MTRPRPALSVAVLGLLLALVGPWAGEVRGDGDKLDEKAMKKKMQGWSRDLGVKCSYCHVQKGKEYDYEAETALKKVAHVCEEKFVERMKINERPVTCADCHDKKAKIFPARDGGPQPGTEAPPGDKK